MRSEEGTEGRWGGPLVKGREVHLHFSASRLPAGQEEGSGRVGVGVIGEEECRPLGRGSGGRQDARGAVGAVEIWGALKPLMPDGGWKCVVQGQ